MTSTRSLSEHMAVLEIMVEMLTAQNMLLEANPDQSLADYGDVAGMMLSQRHTDDEMDRLLSVLDERLVKVRQHVEIFRQQLAKERH